MAKEAFRTSKKAINLDRYLQFLHQNNHSGNKTNSMNVKIILSFQDFIKKERSNGPTRPMVVEIRLNLNLAITNAQTNTAMLLHIIYAVISTTCATTHVQHSFSLRNRNFFLTKDKKYYIIKNKTYLIAYRIIFKKNYELHWLD